MHARLMVFPPTEPKPGAAPRTFHPPPGGIYAEILALGLGLSPLLRIPIRVLVLASAPGTAKAFESLCATGY